MVESLGLILNLAGTGIVPTRAMSPHVPLSHAEIIDDVAACLELGVQMVHLHARGEDGHHTGDPEPYGRLIEDIRRLPGGRDAVICVTTSGRHDSGFASRSRVLDLDGDMKPDMASLTLSSLNFAQQASINAPDVVRQLAYRMLERGIRPELEIFDLGMANFASVLIREELIKPPYYFNILLGNIAGAQATPLHYGIVRDHLPSDSVVAVAGIGRWQVNATMLGIGFADGVRIGLEDNLWFDSARRISASNPQLVQRVLTLAATCERGVATRSEVRHRLGLASVPSKQQ